MGLLRPFEKTSFTKIANHIKLLLDKKIIPILSDNLCETQDTTLVDLAIAIKDSYINLSPVIKP